MFKLFASPSALLLLACSEATATGNIAVIGGVNSILDGPVNSIEIIAQANTEAVQPTKTLEVPRSSVAAASLDGTLYAFGGLNSSGSAVTKCERLDTTKSDGDWSHCPDLPEPLIGHAAAAYDGMVYAIGGFFQGANVNRRGMILNTTDPNAEWVYVKSTMSWSRSWAAAVAVEGKLYVIGGVNGMGRAEQTSEVLDTTLNQVQRDVAFATDVGWNYLKNDNTQIYLKTPRFGHAAATYDGKIYVTGGVICADPKHRCGYPGDGNVNTNEFAAKSLEILDTKSATMSWTYGEQLDTPRQIHASAFIGGTLIVMGGATNKDSWLTGGPTISDTDSVEMLDIANTDAVWVSGTPLTKKRQGFAAVAFTVTDPPTVESVTTAARAIAGMINGIVVEKDSVIVETVNDDVIVKLTLNSDLAAFSEDDFKEALAKKLGVPVTWITLDVKAGSIVVTATVHNPDADVADGPIVADSPIDANSQVSDASHANLALVFFMVVMTSLQLVCY